MKVNFLLVAWRGFSGNKGSPTQKGLYQDARSAVKWLNDNEIGALDERWNWLEGWTSNHNNKKPFAVHYTRGGPWFDEWQDVEFAEEWINERNLYIKNKFN